VRTTRVRYWSSTIRAHFANQNSYRASSFETRLYQRDLQPKLVSQPVTEQLRQWNVLRKSLRSTSVSVAGLETITEGNGSVIRHIVNYGIESLRVP
jgi:hypothetical protein